MIYWRLFADEQGESHFEEQTTEFEMVAYAPPAPALGVSEPMDACRFIFVHFPANWFGEMHCTPRRQLFFVMDGRVEGTTSTGQVAVVEKGDVVLMEDTHGKGHATRALDGKAAHAVMVHLE